MKKLFRKLFLFVKRVINSLDEESKKYVPVAISITQAVKQFLDSPIGDFSIEALKAAIPGTVDDIVIEYIEKQLPSIIVKLKLVNDVNLIEDKEEKVRVILSHLKLCSNEERNTFLQGFVNLTYQCLSDGKLTWGEAALLLEAGFQVIEKQK